MQKNSEKVEGPPQRGAKRLTAGEYFEGAG